MRFNEIINEIKMNPTSLMNDAKKLDAKIGIEYEFVFQFSDLDDPEYEDIEDQRVYDIDNIISFFRYSGDIDPDNLDIFDNIETFLKEKYEEWMQTDTEEKQKLNYKERQFLIDVYGKHVSDVYEVLKNDFDELYWPQKLIDNSPSTEKVLAHFNEYTDRFFGDYVVDSDGSINVDDEYTEIGVEIKNEAPISLEDTFYDLDSMRRYILENGYTNESTGLHINISLPNYNLDNLDYVKLALLLGDEYILNKFNRIGNTYARPALEELSKSRHDPAKILDALQVSLNKIAGKVFFDSYTDKYTSINIHRNRIEFRSPGGDWVNDQSIDFIKQTVLRFIVALDAALDETKYQKEYAKKLYKWIEPDKDYLKDVTKAFALYSIGKLNKEQLKQVVSDIQEVRPKRGPEYEGMKGDYYAFGSLSYVWGSGTTKEQALKDSYKAVIDYNRENPDDLVSWAAERRNLTFLPIDEKTHNDIQQGLVSGLKYDHNRKLYVDRNPIR